MDKTKFRFSNGKRVINLKDIRVGDIYYSQNISKDKKWKETLKRDGLVILKIYSKLTELQKFQVQFIKVKKGKLKIKDVVVSNKKLIKYIKTGKA